MNTHISHWTLALALTSTIGLLAACGGGDPEKLMASAEAYLVKGDARSATIELKTALQKKPDSAAARFLLGKALLAGDEPVGAAVELRKALELKHPPELVLPELVRALLEQGRHKEIITEFGTATIENKEAFAGVKTLVGSAHARMGVGTEAMAAFKQALDAVPGYVPAQTGIARQLAVNGDREAAMKATSDIIASGKADADTWVLQGDLLALAKGDKEGAVAAYRKAIGISRSHLAAHSGIIQLRVATGDPKAAAEQVAELQKLRPAHPMTRYFQAQVAFLQGDHKAAKEIVVHLVKSAPNNPQLNQLAGAIELASGSAEVARAHLSRAVQAAPNSVISRRLLATAYLRSGEANRALEMLQPMLAQAAPDGIALALAGESQMQLGNLDKASAFFAQAAKANPSDVNHLTALARTRFLKGDAVGAVADLEQIAAGDAGTVADLALINAQLRRREFKGALKAIDALERKQPAKPMASHLRGTAYLGLKDPAQARTAFEKALSIDPTFFPAALNLAALDVAEKKPQLAQQRFEAILKKQPGHLRALLALAELRARNGASKQEITDLLATAVRLNPSESAAHLALINHHLLSKLPEAALTAAQQADAALPAQPAILDALGRAQLAAGQPNQALTTFNKIVALQPGNPLAHMRIADMKLASKDPDAAIQSLKRAAAAKPDAPLIQLRLFEIELRAGRSSEAMALARDLQTRQPAHSMGFVLEGDVQRTLKNDDAALTAYKNALKKSFPGAAAKRVHALLWATGKRADADQFEATWTKEHANDIQFAAYLGNAALARRDLSRAESAYRRVIELQPNHVVALNNLAWTLIQVNKPGALALAEKANTIRPNQPSLMDTLALALAAEKRFDQALEVQQKALALAPDNNHTRFGLARIYVQAGQPAKARDLLESLAKLGDKFPAQPEVQRLLAGL